MLEDPHGQGKEQDDARALSLITPSAARHAPGAPSQRNPSTASKVAEGEKAGEHRTCTECRVGDAGRRAHSASRGPGNRHSPSRRLQRAWHADAKARAPAAAPSEGEPGEGADRRGHRNAVRQ